jgi:hypothetical protein
MNAFLGGSSVRENGKSCNFAAVYEDYQDLDIAFSRILGHQFAGRAVCASWGVSEQ